MTQPTIRVAGASGFWGDSAKATRQLLEVPNLDYIVYDYLAEITMSIMARARAKDPAQGYARDFISAAVVPNLQTISDRGVKVISNAGESIRKPALLRFVLRLLRRASISKWPVSQVMTCCLKSKRWARPAWPKCLRVMTSRILSVC